MKTRYKILKYIYECDQKKILVPTYRDMLKETGLNSLASIRQHIVSLSEQGFITFIKYKPRTIKLTVKGIAKIEDKIKGN